MENIWSENKYVNTTINVLLFLLGSNFMHYAQILVPIICLIIFVSNKYKFKINNIKTFIILCLFGISFLYFDRKEGFFAFIGLFIPMAYYIGSNILEPNEEKIKYLIYLFALGMTTHIVLNFACDLAFRGLECFSKNSHYDIWTLNEYPTTQTATNYILILGIIYYLFVYDKNKTVRLLGISLFIISFVYLIALGRRTPVFMFGIIVLLSFIVDFFLIKNRNKKTFVLLVLLLLTVIFGILLFFTYKNDLFGLGETVEHLGIVRKFISVAFYTPRFEIVKDTISLAPKHLFGGREISKIMDLGPHELWLDVFDIAGIIPYVLLVIYSLICLFNIIRVLINSKYDKEFRLLIFGVLVSTVIQFFMEPIVSGSSVILLCMVIIFTSLECLNSK